MTARSVGSAEASVMLSLDAAVRSLPRSILSDNVKVELAPQASDHRRLVGDLDRIVVCGVWYEGRRSGTATVALYPYTSYRTSICVELGGGSSPASAAKLTEALRDAMVANASGVAEPAPTPALEPTPARTAPKPVTPRGIARVATALMMIFFVACGGASQAQKPQAIDATRSVGAASSSSSATGATGVNNRTEAADGPTEAAADPTNAAPAGASPDAARAASNPPLAAGSYVYHLVGSQGEGQRRQDVDRSVTTRVTSLGEATIEAADDRQTMDLTFRPDRTELGSVQIHVPGFTRSFRPDAAVLYAPYPLTEGTPQWSWTLKSVDLGTSTSMTQTTSVGGTQDVVINDQTIHTLLVNTLVEFAGDVTGTIKLSTWVDLQRELPVRVDEVDNVTYGVFRLVSDTSATFDHFDAA